MGDVCETSFRENVFTDIAEQVGLPRICVPAAGITRDRLSVQIDKETGKADVYPVDVFRRVTEINLIAPVYWALEMIKSIAEKRWGNGLKRWDPTEGLQGAVIFIGSVSSQGNRGQVVYGATKAGTGGR